jgi:hypothetical protein
MLKRYSVCLNRDMSEIEKYNFARKWLCDILTYCQTGQTYKDFNFKWESKHRASFTAKEGIISAT